ncbi:hypothetical protein HC776_02410, partial [bacterium]|nr:hypothetical protein [bacterium]
TYRLANLTGLEVQYTTDDYGPGNGANWITIGTPFVDRSKNSGSDLTNETEVRINLRAVGDVVFAAKGNRKFRLRFAMLVNKLSVADKSGWWIDNISIQRVDRPRFTRYPFLDTVETTASDVAWQSLGTWGRVEGGQNAPSGSKGNAFTDSPAGNYQNNDKSALELRYPLDLRADSKSNPNSPACTLGALCDAVKDPKAINPVMTFWWTHEMGAGDTFLVEWKLKSEAGTAWKPLWTFKEGMGANVDGATPRSSTLVSKAWERVEIDLRPVTSVLADVPGDDTEDDIVLRFNLVTNGSSTGPGIFVDNIEIADRVDNVWYLWPTSETRTDAAGATIKNAAGGNANGSGTQYINSGEDINVSPPEWFVGGNWAPISWEVHDGLNAFHDSPTDGAVAQVKAEVGNGDTNIANTQRRSFNVLELNTIFDLRGTTSLERPILYFWSRYNVGANSAIYVQVAREKTPPASTCPDGVAQCYEKMYGWNDWQTVWRVKGERTNLAWNREQVSLVPYTKNGITPGSRIRIRFVTDTLDGTTDRDGWYVDQFSVSYYYERRINITPSSSFVDNSTDMANWIGEGEWGLDPELYKGGGGQPISLGPNWTVNYWTFAGTTGGNALSGT